MDPQEILNKKFEKSKVFGYKTSDVDDFISEVFKSYSELCNEKEELEKKVDFLVDKLAEYRNQENKLTDILLEAKKVSDNVIKKSKEKAEEILNNASSKSEEIVSMAKKEVEKQQNLLSKLQKETSDFKNKMLSLYKSHVDLISTLPSYKNDENSDSVGKNESENEKNLENEKKTNSLKERTFSISLNKNGMPVKVDEENIADTQNIALKEDVKKVLSKYDFNEDKNKNSKFQEPLRFGNNYTFNNKNKKNKSK